MPLEEKSVAPAVVGAVDRLHVVEAGLHQDRHVAAVRLRAQRAADIEPAHSRHHHIENHAVDRLRAELLPTRLRRPRPW